MDGSKLAGITLFADLTDDERSRLAEKMHEVEVFEDTYLVERGDLSYKFFVILDGKASVEQRGRHMGHLGPGDFFGEMGILAKMRRNADVIATTPMQLAVLAGWDMREMLEEFPRIRIRVEDAVEDRT